MLPGLDDEGADMLPGLDDEGVVMPPGSDVEPEPVPDVEDGLTGQRGSDGVVLQSFLSLLFERGFSGVVLPEEEPPDDGDDCANP
jgi:hypothetical protein